MNTKVKIVHGPSGNCPVQAEGYINGHPFYFRARGAFWSLRVNRKKGVKYDFKFCDDDWYYSEEYKGENYEPLKEGQQWQFSAGWAEKEECIEFINKIAKKFVKENASRKKS